MPAEASFFVIARSAATKQSPPNEAEIASPPLAARNDRPGGTNTQEGDYLRLHVEENRCILKAMAHGCIDGEGRQAMIVSNPLSVLRNLEQIYEDGFRDKVTDAVLLRVASSQVARDEAALRDIERDLSELEQQYKMPSDEFFDRWQAGKLDDTADFMDWSALYQMACEVRERLTLLRDEG
jgi:hypothetical protein